MIIPYLIDIRRVSDNRTITVPFSWDIDDPEWQDEGVLFIWTEGNYSCDCNRHIFVERTMRHESPHYLPHHQCGDSAYRLVSIRNALTGMTVEIPKHLRES